MVSAAVSVALVAAASARVGSSSLSVGVVHGYLK